MGLKASIRIIVIDETSSMRKATKTMLTQIGFKNIKEAPDGQSAWELLQAAAKDNAPYEFIISDHSMEKLTGLDLLKLVRSDAVMKDTPFLMVTADADQNNVLTAVKAGVNNFIVKPFSAVTLKEKIEKIFFKDKA